MPTKTFCTYNNNKARFSAELMQRRHAKDEAYSSRNKVLSDQTRNTLTWKIKVAKRHKKAGLTTLVSIDYRTSPSL